MVDILRPERLSEALEYRAKRAALPFSGGTDLMVRHRAMNGLPPSLAGPVLFLDNIQEIRQLRFTGEHVDIGAALPLAVVADDPGACAAYLDGLESGKADAQSALDAIPGLLRMAAADVGAPALRQRATLAGNAVNASPAGDAVAAMYALKAQVILTSTEGERVLPISEFITGPGKTVLSSSEIVTAFRLPPSTWHYWRKVGTRRANALTKLSLAASARMENGRIHALDLALGAVAPTVLHFDASPIAAQAMAGGVGEENLIRQALENLEPRIVPIDDQRSTARYRKTVALNLIRDAMSSFITHIKELS